MSTAPFVSNGWSVCGTFRDDSVGNGDYPERLSYLIFLKMECLRHEPGRTIADTASCTSSLFPSAFVFLTNILQLTPFWRNAYCPTTM